MGRADTDTLAQVRDSVARFAEAVLRPEAPAYEARRDFPYALIEKMGYAGWVSCEYHPRAGTLEGLGWAR